MTAEAIRYLIIISSTAALIVIAAVIYIITKSKYKKNSLRKNRSFRLPSSKKSNSMREKSACFLMK